MKIKFSLIFCLAIVLANSLFSSAQTTGGLTAIKQKNLILLNGRPQVLLWARDLQDPQDLPAYKRAGFTALYIGITASDESLARVKTLLAAAQGDNFPVIVGLDARAAQINVDGAAVISVNPASSAYQVGVQSFLGQVVGELGNHPQIIAWIIENLNADRLAYSTGDYRFWLQNQYQNIGELNTAWGTDFADLQQITPDTVGEVDAALPGGLGRAALSVGLYHKSRYRDLLDLWAGSLRRLDQRWLIILGGQPDFRSLMVPAEIFAGQVAGAYLPRFAEAGGWQGIEAIDMARQDNRFAAFAFADVRSGVSGGTLYDWVGQALVHGAAGLGLDNWESIKGNADLLSALSKINDRFIKTGAFPQTPQADTAFIYTPMAGGAGYSFSPQPASAEPGILFSTFARGTRFGLVDYLCEETLPQADLRRYTTIFAPLAFTVYRDSQTSLANYVQGGGTLLVDWGFAVYDSGSLHYLPDGMSRLFGVGSIGAYTRTPLDIAVISPDELFPSLPFQAMTSGQDEGSAFSGLVGDTRIMGEAKRFMTIYAYAAYAPSIVINREGEGHALFASAPLWENWRRGDNLFQEFHYDLLSRNPSLVVERTGLFAEADAARYERATFGIYRPANLAAVSTLRSEEIGNRVYFLGSGCQVLGDDPHLVFSGSGGNFAFPLALQASPSTTTYLQVKSYGTLKIVLELHGSGALITTEGGVLNLSGGSPFTLTLTLQNSGIYDFADGSRHQLTLKPLGGGAPTVRKLVASGGALQISHSGTAVEMTLEPSQ